MVEAIQTATAERRMGSQRGNKSSMRILSSWDLYRILRMLLAGLILWSDPSETASGLPQLPPSVNAISTELLRWSRATD